MGTREGSRFKGWLKNQTDKALDSGFRRNDACLRATHRQGRLDEIVIPVKTGIQNREP